MVFCEELIVYNPGGMKTDGESDMNNVKQWNLTHRNIHGRSSYSPYAV